MFNVGTDAITANHTSKKKVIFNEYVANVLRDNIGSKNKSASSLRKKVLNIKNLTQSTQSKKVNDFCYVSKF